MNPGNDNRPAAALATTDDISRLLGPLSDHTIIEILSFAPTINDIESAATYLSGDGDTADIAAHPLAGSVARIHDAMAKDKSGRYFRDTDR